MQILLTEEEHNALKSAVAKERDKLAETLQDLCTKVADHMPVKWGWGTPDPKPWGCILTTGGEWYCDQCPVQEACPNPRKEWSK